MTAPRQRHARWFLPVAAMILGAGLDPAGSAADTPAETESPPVTAAGSVTKAGAAGSFAPWLLQPLAVGNCWTYRWKCPLIPAETGDEINAKDTPLAKGLRRYEFKDKGAAEIADLRTARVHEEIYMISSKVEHYYFFTVSTNPEIPAEQIRDGRFADAVETCWTWWDCRKNGDGNMGLTESIKRNWAGYVKAFPGNPPVPGDYPADHRNSIQIEFAHGAWGKQWVDLTPAGSRCRYRYKTVDQVVDVPAGRFNVSLQTIEKVTQDGSENSPVLWETQAWWVQGVGKIREQQILADGNVTYELELLRYSLSDEAPEPPPVQP